MRWLAYYELAYFDGLDGAAVGQCRLARASKFALPYIGLQSIDLYVLLPARPELSIHGGSVLFGSYIWEARARAL